jgi:hypothetical protein
MQDRSPLKGLPARNTVVTRRLGGIAGPKGNGGSMQNSRRLWLGLLALLAITATGPQASAQQQQQKPNILFIMGDDIGLMQPSIYHQGLMVGETASSLI